MIGVFDSGLGGLTVLRGLIKAFPEEDFLYFGDSAFAPYGRRTPDEIYTLTRRGVEYLFSKGCHLVIIACNTACAIALRKLQQEWLPRSKWGIKKAGVASYNVLGVFIPMIEAITGEDWHLRPLMPYNPPKQVQRVGFFATRATVNSNRFFEEMQRLAPNIVVIQQACHRLADFIEADANLQDIDNGIQRYCRNLMVQAKAAGVDLVVLGCTHYQLVAEIFKKHLPPDCKFVHQPEAVAKSLQKYLTKHPQFKNQSSQNQGVRFATSGDHVQVSRAATRFWGANAEFIYKDDIQGVNI